MEFTVEELGKLKYAVALEISLDEIKPTYDSIYRGLKNTRLNGFRPGKHPKGWLEKRFKSAMQKEAVNHVIPRYLDDALKEHSLRPVTTPVIQKIDFNRGAPLSATLQFEISPKLDPPDYGKKLLERKDIEKISAKDITEELNALLQREEIPVPKDKVNAKVENGDLVLINFNGKIDGKAFVGSNANDIHTKIGGTDLTEFHAYLLGMSVGEEKEVKLELPERFGENAGKKADFKIQLNEISTLKKPVMDEEFFKKFGVTDEEELKDKVEENIKSRKTAELQSEYRIAVRSQLSSLYDEFDLPEELMKFEQEQVDKELEKVESEKDIQTEEKGKRRQVAYDSAKLDLRMKFILDSIREHEEMHFDENEAAREFVGLAQITGQSPDKLIQSTFGKEMYHSIVVRKQGDATLDRVVARVFGNPIVECGPDEEQEHKHDENCEHHHS